MRLRRLTLLILVGVIAASTKVSVRGAEGETPPALDVFNQRILPILKAPNASSCSECHLSGVDLKDYIMEDQAKTFAALRERGLIDVEQPEKSKLLTFIARTPDSPSPVGEKVRQLEFDAFKTWIVAAVKDPDLLKSAAVDDESFPTTLPLEVIRHARKDRVLQSFVDNVWSQMGRCVGCHAPEKNERLVTKFGDRVSWIVAHDPAATLERLVDGGNIEFDDPELSPLVTKPAGIEKHGGGPKFLVGDLTHKQFITFLTDYAAVMKDRYASAKDLPKPPVEITSLTRQHLRIAHIPERFAGLPMRVDLYRWDRENRRWSEDRWATAFSPVNGKQQIWQHNVTMTAPRESERVKAVRAEEPRLPNGAYLAKLYLDREKKTAADYTYELGDAEYIGQVEITGPWEIGYQTPKIVNFPASESARE